MGVGSKTHPLFKGPPKGILSDQQVSETMSNLFQKASIPTCSLFPFNAAFKSKALGIQGAYRALEGCFPGFRASALRETQSSWRRAALCIPCSWITVLFSFTVRGFSGGLKSRATVGN